jgi:uncharacterized protein (TIGR03435 family)
MRNLYVWLAVALSIVPLSAAQTAFDAASVKPAEAVAAAPNDEGKTVARKQAGGGMSERPGRIHYRESLARLMTRAYDVDYLQIQGPDSLHAMFVVDAVMPATTTREQLRIMLRNLLVERFKLQTHRETKEVSGYSLAVAKGGPKLKPAAQAVAAGPPPDPRQRPALGPDGFPETIPLVGKSAETGTAMFSSPYGWKLFFFGKTMHDLTGALWERLRAPVDDATGLTEKYDFSLTYLPDDWPAGRGGGVDTKYPPAPDLFRALESQLGLRLEKKKIAVEMLVVDHAEKTPTDAWAKIQACFASSL